MARYLIILAILLCFGVGCARNIFLPKEKIVVTKEEYQKEIAQKERDKIFKVYDNFIPNPIILAFEKIYGDTFDIAKNYLQYAKEDNPPTFDGFYVWLIKNLWYKDRFDRGDEFGIYQEMIDNRFNDKEYQELKKNYELLEKMNE